MVGLDCCTCTTEPSGHDDRRSADGRDEDDAILVGEPLQAGGLPLVHGAEEPRTGTDQAARGRSGQIGPAPSSSAISSTKRCPLPSTCD